MSFLGIDIGQQSIKAVSIEKDIGGKLFLESIGEIKTPIDTSGDKSRQKYLGVLADAIKSLLSDLKLKEKKVVVALPENEVVSRLVRLPPLKESEIMDALKFEAETFVPYPLDEVSIDYEVIEKDDAGRLAVFVIAAKNDLIADRIKLFKLLKLELTALESPSVALRRVVKNSVKTVERVIMLDVGEKFSDIFNFNKGNVYFARSLSVGGESLTRAISLGLGLDMASAEEYKKAYGINENELEGKIRKVALPVFSSIVDEVRKAINVFSEDVGGKMPELLVLSGGGANLPGMAEELTRTLGIEVQVSQPFVDIDMGRIKTPFDLNTEGCRFSLAVGLSLRGLI